MSVPVVCVSTEHLGLRAARKRRNGSWVKVRSSFPNWRDGAAAHFRGDGWWRLVTRQRNSTSEVYLLHFARPLKHARHYLGRSSDRASRMKAHRAGRGAAILAACRDKGIGWRCVRVWRNATADLERQLKQRHRADLCPVCSGPSAYKRGRP